MTAAVVGDKEMVRLFKMQGHVVPTRLERGHRDVDLPVADVSVVMLMFSWVAIENEVSVKNSARDPHASHGSKRRITKTAEIENQCAVLLQLDEKKTGFLVNG